jgi:hypothetical protein
VSGPSSPVAIRRLQEELGAAKYPVNPIVAARESLLLRTLALSWQRRPPRIIQRQHLLPRRPHPRTPVQARTRIPNTLLRLRLLKLLRELGLRSVQRFWHRYWCFFGENGRGRRLFPCLPSIRTRYREPLRFKRYRSVYRRSWIVVYRLNRRSCINSILCIG